MNSSNKHLKSKIDEIGNFTSTHNNPPEDLVESFIKELKVSRLYIPATHNDDEIVFEHLESEDGITVLPLFTSPEEYDGETELLNYEFEFYAEIIADCDFRGAVINPESDEVFVSNQITDHLRAKPLPEYSEDEILDAHELKEVAANVKNERLANFIRDESNFNNFDALIGVLSESVLLNVVSSPRDLSEISRDGIIATLEVGGFNLAVMTNGTEKYAVVFTSLEAITDTCDTSSGLHYYYQVTSYDRILEFVLRNDLDGMVIDPSLEDYYIPRNVLLDIYVNHPEIVNNPKYSDGIYYAFTM